VKAWVYEDRLEVFAFFARGRFFAAAGRSLAQRLAEGRPIDAPRLADDPGYCRVAGHIRVAGSHAHAYFSWGDLLERGIQHVSADQGEADAASLRSLFTGMGLMNFRRYGVAYHLDARGVREIDHMDLEGEPAGLARLAGAIGTGLDLPARMSAGTLLYHGGRFDFARAWDIARQFMEVFAETTKERMPAKAAAWMASAEDDLLGFKLKEDLLATLGDEYGVAVGLSPSGGVIPDAVAVIKVRDPERLRATLARVSQQLAEKDVRVSTGRFDNTIYHVFRGTRRGITPSVAIRDDVLAIGLTVQSLKRFLRPTGERLPASKSYGKALAAAGLQDLESVSFLDYLDLPQAIIYGHNLGVPLLSMLDTDDLGLPFELDIATLPTAEALAGGFTPVISVKRVGPDGITTEVISPLPLSTINILSVLAGIIAERSAVKTAPKPERQ